MNSNSIILLFLLFGCIYADRYFIWVPEGGNAWSNDWTAEFFGGVGLAPQGDIQYKGASSIWISATVYGGASIRHDAGPVDISQYKDGWLEFQFYWNNDFSKYTIGVEIKQLGEVWSNRFILGNLTKGEWNAISIPVSAINLTASVQINQIQIQKLDTDACDAWVNNLYFTDRRYNSDGSDSSTLKFSYPLSIFFVAIALFVQKLFQIQNYN